MITDAGYQRIADRREWFQAYTEGIVCIHCGNALIEWHHRIPRTRNSQCIGTMLAHGASIARIKAELELCDPVCKKCHGIQHQKSHCKYGHAMTPDNVRVRRTGRRVCLTCNRAYWKRWRAHQRISEF